MLKTQNKVKILCVTDQSKLRTMTKDFFGRIKDNVEFYDENSAQEGIKRATELEPNIILMDMCLHGISGVDAARTIKSILPKTKIILFTMYLCDSSPIGI